MVRSVVLRSGCSGALRQGRRVGGIDALCRRFDAPIACLSLSLSPVLEINFLCFFDLQLLGARQISTLCWARTPPLSPPSSVPTAPCGSRMALVISAPPVPTAPWCVNYVLVVGGRLYVLYASSPFPLDLSLSYSIRGFGCCQQQVSLPLSDLAAGVVQFAFTLTSGQDDWMRVGGPPQPRPRSPSFDLVAWRNHRTKVARSQRRAA